ncbi:g7145 [Coccomyxa elongata]
MATVAAASSRLSEACDYSSLGPCIPTSNVCGSCPAKDSSGKETKLRLKITVPGQDASVSPPYPVLFFFNGFQARLSFYQDYAEHLASFGFILVQYENPPLCIIPDKHEVEFLDGILSWLADQNSSEGSRLFGLLNFDRIGVAGHSRGAKLACLHFANRAQVKAAYLIDPVDNTDFTPESADYPSAVRALLQSGQPVAITGAGIIGRCNPNGSNYKEFFSAAAAKSWLTVVAQSSHTEFLNAGCLLNRAFALLCGARGRNSFQETLSLTAPPLLAWMESQLRSDDAGAEKRLMGFYRFMDAEEAAGTVRFHIKPGATRGTEEHHSTVQAHPMQTQGSANEGRLAESSSIASR